MVLTIEAFYDTYPLTCITSFLFRVNPWFQLPLRDIPVPDPQTLLESKDYACKKAGYLCGRNVLKICLTDLGDSILFPTRRHFDQCSPDCVSTHWFLDILDENRGSSPLPKGSLVKVLIWKHDSHYLFSSWGSHIMTSYDHVQPCNASIVLICLDENSTFSISTTISKSPVWRLWKIKRTLCGDVSKGQNI